MYSFDTAEIHTLNIDTMNDERNESAVDSPLQYSVTELLEHNKNLRAEMTVLTELIQSKYCEQQREYAVANSSDTTTATINSKSSTSTTSTTSTEHVSHSSTNNKSKCSVYEQKLVNLIRIIEDVEKFIQDDGFNENVVNDYIDYLAKNHDYLLIVKPADVLLLKHAPDQIVQQYLDTKAARTYEKVLFLLRQNNRYSLILFNSSKREFYHYDTRFNNNTEFAKLVISRLQHYFQVDKLIEVKCKSDYDDSSLLIIENIMNIISDSKNSVTAADAAAAANNNNNNSNNKADTMASANESSPYPLDIANTPSPEDYLKIIIMSHYIVNKYTQIETLVENESNSKLIELS